MPDKAMLSQGNVSGSRWPSVLTPSGSSRSETDADDHDAVSTAAGGMLGKGAIFKASR
jgi:hypothetical protein